jgi:hypothetical protein
MVPDVASSYAGSLDGLPCSSMEEPDAAVREGGFIADARRASAGRQPSSAQIRPTQGMDGWQVVTHRMQWW